MANNTVPSTSRGPANKRHASTAEMPPRHFCNEKDIVTLLDDFRDESDDGMEFLDSEIESESSDENKDETIGIVGIEGRANIPSHEEKQLTVPGEESPRLRQVSAAATAKIVSRPEKVAVITGGARGLGVEVVRGLLQCNMNVIIGCRNVEAGEKMIEKIRASGNYSGRAACVHLDLMSLKSVQSFAEVVMNKHPRLHYLINNAGIMFVPYQLTEDGYESHFAVNYLGHCLLTHLLLPHLKAGGQEQEINSRIVNVSSCAYMAGSIHFKDFSMKDMYIPSAAYAQSKLAQILFTNHLDRLLKMDEAPVQIHSVHPGIVNTDLFNGTLLKTIAPWAPYLFFKTPQQGAASVLYACLSADLEGRGGTYISNCQVSETTSKARDQVTQECLWSAMLNMIHVNKFGEK